MKETRLGFFSVMEVPAFLNWSEILITNKTVDKTEVAEHILRRVERPN
jgi:hypothetical protein